MATGITPGDISDLLRAIANSNQMDFDEKKRQFDLTLAWAKEQFGWSQQEFKLQYSLAVKKFNEDMRQFNAKLSAELVGSPKSPLTYAAWSHGVNDIYGAAAGGQAVPAFGAQPGKSERASIFDFGGGGYMEEPDWDKILNPAPPAQATGSDDAALDWIWENRKDIAANLTARGDQDVSTPEGRRKALRFFMSANVQGQSPSEWATGMGYKPVAPVKKPTTGETVDTGNRGYRGPFPMGGGTEMPADYYLGGRRPQSPYPSASGQPLGVGGGTPQPRPSIKQALIQGSYGTQAARQPSSLPPDIRPQQYLPGSRPVTGPYIPEDDDFRRRYGSPGSDPRSLPEPPGNEPEPVPPGMDPGIWAALGPEARALYRTQGYLVRDPHQIGTAYWDSLDDRGKGAILNAAELGYTPSGFWTADRYTRLVDAARPKGTAPRRVGYNWNQPQRSLF